MGGNAIKTVPIRRIDAAEYFTLRDDIVGKLKPWFKQVQDIPAYSTKKDFGDIDILCDPDNLSEQDSNPEAIRQFLLETFQPHEMHRNGEVYSFDYQAFQVDIITTHTRTMPIHLTYYAFNDLGNLMGKLANSFGLKFGHKGLYSAVRTNDGTTHLGEVELSVSPKEILTFLGYDYDRYQKGFDTLDEIFEFAASTRYFNREVFSFDNLRHADRVRNKKRPVYQAFISWIDKHPDLPAYSFEENPMKYIGWLDRSFPDARLIDTRNDLFSEFERSKAIQAKLREAIQPLGLEGKTLGEAMIKFKQTHDDYKAFVEQSTPEDILASFSGEPVVPDLT